HRVPAPCRLASSATVHECTDGIRQAKGAPRLLPAAGQRPTHADNFGISARPTTGDGRSWTTCPLLRIRCSRACCAPDRAVILADTNQQAWRLICAPICARDAAGHAETGETQKTWDGFMLQICRGQRADKRLFETRETHVVWL